MSKDKKRVVIAMSGGVDSSVAAYILKEQGYEVIGITMQIWQDENRCDIEDKGGCCGLSAVEDARAVANQLDIPYYVLNFKKEFNDTVIQYFIDEYFKGRTPNPCIACNRYVKWEALLHKCLQLEADYIATGHYARIEHLDNGRFTLRTSATARKDQTYALYNLTQHQLSHTLMPVGDYTKDEIRQMAEKIGLDVANKPDSQEICFIPDNDYGAFLEENSDYKIVPGDFVDTKGNVLGRHKGIVYYTVGQRKGLGIAFGKPVFVKHIDPEKNQVVLADNSEVFSSGLVCDDINMMAIDRFDGELSVMAKIRYSHKAAPAKIKLDGNQIICTFSEPQRAVTPGQSAVFYDDSGRILCGGTIINGI